jgi:AraC-like DNA-binding protein
VGDFSLAQGFQHVAIVSPIFEGQQHSHHYVQIGISQSAPIQISSGAVTTDIQAYLILPNIPHRLKTQANRCVTLLLDPYSRFGKNIIHQFSQHESKAILATGVYSLELKACLNYLEELLALFKTQDSIPYEKSLMQLLQSLSYCNFESGSKDPRIDKALILMENSDLTHIKLHEIATQLALSPSRFTHLFSQHMGLPFRSYIRYLRCSRVIEQLSQGASLTTAAYASGYSDAAHLSREFKSLFGISPKLIKKNLTYRLLA